MEGPIKTSSETKNMAEAHWRYIEDVLRLHGVNEEVISKIGYHYRTAMTHGYKHGVEDAQAELTP